MVSLHDEITAATQTLGVSPNQFRRVEGEERARILGDVIRRYVRRPDARWWWEAFTCRCVVVSFRGKDWRWLSRFVEAPADGLVWFIAGAEEDDPILLYETTVATGEAILGQCYLFEYYFAAHDLSWLAGENHHGTCFALGFRLMRRLRAYVQERPDEISTYCVSSRCDTEPQE